MCSTVSSALLSIYGVCDLLCLHLHIQLLDYHWQMRKKCVFLANRDTSSHTHLIHGAISIYDGVLMMMVVVACDLTGRRTVLPFGTILCCVTPPVTLCKVYTGERVSFRCD